MDSQLTLPQQDIYYEQLLYDKQPIYNIGAKATIEGVLDKEVFEKAYLNLIRKHDVFNRTISEKAGVPLFTNLNGKINPLYYKDFSKLKEAEKLADMFVNKEFIKTFPFSTKSFLYKFYLVKVHVNLHYLLGVYHHIITDGWGTSLMFDRLVRNYNEILETGTIQSDYPFKYADYMVEDQAYRNSDTYNIDQTYWKEKYRSFSDVCLQKKSTTKSNQSRRESLVIPRDQYNTLIQFAKEHKSSTFHVLLGVLYSYIARCYSCSDISIGLPVLNRGKYTFKRTVGLFMGVLPLRIHVDVHQPFEVLMENIRMQLRKDYRHQKFPLGKLIQELKITTKKDSLFNITLSYEKHNYANSFLNTTTKVVPLSHNSERSALAIYIREFDENEDVKIDFDYGLNYFDKATIKPFVKNFYGLFTEVIKDASKKINQYEFLSPLEKDKIVFKFNETARKYALEHTVTQLIDEQCARFSKKIAIFDNDKKYSYESIKKITDNIAAYISVIHEKNDKSPIGIMMERSADFLLILIGFLKTGRPFIPLDPAFPESRLSYILENSNASVLIGSPEEISKFSESLLTINSDEILLQSELKDKLKNRLEGNSFKDSAYIIYTSGSTGNPKGVEIQHGSLMNFLKSMTIRPGITAEDLLFSVTTPSFDISMLEFFLPLTVGASVYIPPKSILENPKEILRCLNEYQPTIIQATPGFYDILFNSGWQGNSSLKVLCGGDALSEKLAASLLQKTAEVWNMYGPTETTIWSCVKKILVKEDAKCIGSPIHNTSIYILDDQMEIVPIGISGEIWIGGEGLAKGYYKNGVLTNESFVKNPFVKGGRIYKTGDFGYWNDLGQVMFLGRKDGQLKVRGFRIELAEVENNLNKLTEVLKAVVVAKPDLNQNNVLVAYIQSNKTLNHKKIKEDLKGLIPVYMIPDILIRVDNFPLTPNTKIDRKSLRERTVTFHSDGDEQLSKPTDTIEKELSLLWRKALGIQVANIDADFFEIGGHSIVAAELAYAISESFGLDFTLKEVFLRPTIRLQTTYLISSETKSYQPIPKQIYYGLIDLAPVQMGMWLICQQEAVSASYNMFAVFNISGDLSIEILEKSFNSIINENDILRANFVEKNSVPKLKIEEVNQRSNKIKRIEVSNEATQLRTIQDFVHSTFDLERDNLIQMIIVGTAAANRKLVFKSHHLIMDGISVNILIDRLTENYNAIRNSGKPIVSTSKINYVDFANWSFNRLATQEIQNSKKHYEEYFKDFDFSKSMYAQKKAKTFLANKTSFSIENELYNALRDFMNSSKSSLHILLLSTINALIYRTEGRKKFCVGIPISGRDHPSLKNLLGMFVNTVPLLNTFNNTESFENLIAKTKNAFLKSLEHQEYPLFKLQSEHLVQGLPFDIMVTFQDKEFNTSRNHRLADADLIFCDVRYRFSRFPMIFNFIEKEHSILCEVEYNETIFSKSAVAKLVKSYLNLVSLALRNSESPLMDIDINHLANEKIIKRKPALKIDFNF